MNFLCSPAEKGTNNYRRTITEKRFEEYETNSLTITKQKVWLKTQKVW